MKRRKFIFCLGSILLVAALALPACKKEEPKDPYSVGLRFRANADKKSCNITGMGTCTDEHVILPPKINDYLVTGIAEGAFKQTKIKAITVPEMVTFIGKNAFAACAELTKVDLPNGVTTIGESAFSYCTGMETFIVPGKVTVISPYAFLCCESMTEVTLPKNLTSIGYSAFAYCTKLKTVTIPATVTNISDMAFAECSSLKRITFDGTKEQWNAITKGSLWDMGMANYTIDCKDGNITK